VLTPVPENTTAPGVLINLQVPVAGNPVNRTAPVVMVHVGCVIAPTAGRFGVTGGALITICIVGSEVHPAELVTI